MKKYKIGDTFLMMEFDRNLSSHFSFNENGRYPTKEFDINKCQVISVEVLSLNADVYADDRRIVSKIKYTVKIPDYAGVHKRDIFTDDGKFNYFFLTDENKKRITVIVGKDIAEIKKNITKLSKAIIEQLSPRIRNEKDFIEMKKI